MHFINYDMCDIGQVSVTLKIAKHKDLKFLLAAIEWKRMQVIDFFIFYFFCICVCMCVWI